jgi:hypothetical protein
MKKRNKVADLTSLVCFNEAVRYYKNAKQILGQAEIQYNRYVDTKPVQESAGMAYLAMLKAIDGFLIESGIDPNHLPTSTVDYQLALKRFSARNGKVLAAFHTAREHLHVFGYYRGGTSVEMIKEGFESARFVIEKLSGKKM